MSTLSEMIMRHGPPIGDVVEHYKREAEQWRQRYDMLVEAIAKNAFMHAHPAVTLMAEPESFKAGEQLAERKMLQLFTDPENQPTQHGTVTVEYMQREIAAERKRSEQEMSMMSEHCAEQILMEREACARIAERSESGLHSAFAIRARGRA